MVAKIGDKSWIALIKLETREKEKEKEKEIDSGWIDRRSNLFERWQGKRCLFFFFSLLFDTRAKILGWGEDDLISTWTARDGYMERNEGTVCIRSRGKSIVGLCSIRWSLSLCSAREATRACIYWHSRWMDTFVAAEVAMRDDARGEGRGEGVLRSRSTIASTCLKFPFFFFLFFLGRKGSYSTEDFSLLRFWNIVASRRRTYSFRTIFLRFRDIRGKNCRHVSDIINIQNRWKEGQWYPIIDEIIWREKIAKSIDGDEPYKYADSGGYTVHPVPPGLGKVWIIKVVEVGI